MVTHKFKDLKKRILISSLMIIGVFILVFFSNIFFMKYVIAIALSVLAAVAILEYISIVQLKKCFLNKNILISAGVLEVYSFLVPWKMAPLIVFFIFIIILFFIRFKEIANSLEFLSFSIFGFVYIAMPLGLVLPILYNGGSLFLIYVLAVSKIADIGAYFGGRLWGKKSLAKTLSPKKTIEGFICGSLASTVVSVCFYKLFPNIIYAVFLGLILGLLAQFGDLSESLIKRDANVKDSAKIPSIGGFLDMLDSLLFNIPLVFFLLGVFK